MLRKSRNEISRQKMNNCIHCYDENKVSHSLLLRQSSLRTHDSSKISEDFDIERSNK